METDNPAKPILLYDGSCAVCQTIANWVQKSAATQSSGPRLLVQAIGDDPAALQRTAPGLDIWEAYKTNYLIVPNGPMKHGGEAVAEVFRILPITSWAAGIFEIHILGGRPFQAALNTAYAILTDVRPLLGCGSCGAPKPWVRPIHRLLQWSRKLIGKAPPTKSPAYEKAGARQRGSQARAKD